MFTRATDPSRPCFLSTKHVENKTLQLPLRGKIMPQTYPR